MRITENRRTDLNDLNLNQPERFHEVSAKMKEDRRPLRFSSPIYQPLTPNELAVVHPENSNTTGGFFGMTRSEGKQAHKGIDIEAKEKTDVVAAEDGVVSYAGWAKGYGNVVYINHRDGYQTRYAHLESIDVKNGQKVAQGDFIGKSGKTGNADGPKILAHLHFEILKKDESGTLQALDPLPFFTAVRPDRQLHLILEGILE